VRKLVRQRIQFGFRKPDPRQGGDMRDGGFVQCHAFTISGTNGQNELSSVVILSNPSELRDVMPAGTRLMGLDVGTKTIGLALSDTRRIIATPLETIRRRRFREDMARLSALIEAHGVAGLVIGLPLTLAGTDGPRTQSIRQFARNLVALRDLPVVLWDERLSTAAVTREMIAADITRKRRSEIVDRVAAAYILQGCLDFLGRPA
jgi:putative Holliday junction resolvase